MIIIPETPNVEDLVIKHFLSVKEHEAVAVKMQDLADNGIVHMLERRNKSEYKDIYTFGYDWNEKADKLTYALFNSAPNSNIWCIPKIDDPERVEYIFKQQRFPNVDHYYNAEPFLRFHYKTARLYYHAVCKANSFSDSDLMVGEYGDFWNVSHSEYEQKRMRNVRDLICLHDIKHVLDVGTYLGQLADLIEMNGVEVFRTDISPEILNRDSKIHDMKTMSATQIAENIKEAVLFASVLFAYKTSDVIVAKIFAAIKLAKPKYIVYEDSILNFDNISHRTNKWVEEFGQYGYYIKGEPKMLDGAIEPFYGNKNIRRHGSFAAVLEHF